MSEGNGISEATASKISFCSAASGEDVDNIEEETNSCEEESRTMTKRHMRKLRKHKQWLEKLPEKRAKEKQRKKQRRQEARERGETLGPTRKMLKLNSMEKSSCKVNVVLDCSFDGYMGDRDVMKLTKQIGFCYSVNRRAKNPLQFYVCGVLGRMKERLESVGDYKNWDVNFTEKHYDEVYEKEKIIYLTSDSPNTLEDLSDDHAYIIGGLVDHNHYKGLCYQMAEERNLAHAQLPIGEYVTMKSRKILTVNHVFEILLKYTETKDWKASFFSIIPQRKVEKDETTTGTQKDINDTAGETDIQKCANNETDSRISGGQNEMKKSNDIVKDSNESSPSIKDSNDSSPSIKDSNDSSPSIKDSNDSSPSIKNSNDSSPSIKESNDSLASNDPVNVELRNTCDVISDVRRKAQTEDSYNTENDEKS